MPEAFGRVPEVVGGLLREEAENVWRTWNPLIWTVIKHRGCFGQDAVAASGEPRSAIRERFLSWLFHRK